MMEVVVSALLAACVPGGGEQRDGQSATRSRAPVTVRSWLLQGHEPNLATETAERPIKEQHSHLTLDHEKKGASNQVYLDAVVASAVADSLPDLLYVHGTHVQSFIRKGFLKALDPYLTRDKAFAIKVSRRWRSGCTSTRATASTTPSRTRGP
ncbi:MAG TPA: hypothetical protein VGW38_15545 [Chloroflexota bacterium]|nr:hypothetical protein [Chloroflexota bacterium]